MVQVHSLSRMLYNQAMVVMPHMRIKLGLAREPVAQDEEPIGELGEPNF